MKEVLSIVLFICLCSCVSQKKYNELASENKKLKFELDSRNKNFKKEIDRLVESKFNMIKNFPEDKHYFIQLAQIETESLKDAINSIAEPPSKYDRLLISFVKIEDEINHRFDSRLKQELHKMYVQKLKFEWMTGEEYKIDLGIVVHNEEK